MIKNYIADFPTKKEMYHFINKYQDNIKVQRFKKMYIYNSYQWTLYFEADNEFVDSIR